MAEIPQVFHAFWDGSNLPERYGLWLAKWVDLNPDWRLELWDRGAYLDEFGDAPTAHYLDHRTWSRVSNPWQWFADIARVEIMARHGGVWLDCDLEPLRPIDPLVKVARAGGFVGREDDNWICNAFFGAPAGAGWLGHAVQQLPRRVEALRGYRCNRVTGPGFFTEILADHPEVDRIDPSLWAPMHWSRLDQRGTDFPDAYCVHHWANTSGWNRGRR